MPENIAAVIAMAQTVIFLTVLIVWVSMAWKLWSRETNRYTAVHWGAALLILSLWRAYAFVDSITLEIISPEGGWAMTLIVWVVVALICSANLILWLRGPDERDK